MTAATPSPSAPLVERLHDQIIAAIRVRNYSRRTEQAYWHWTRQFVLWSGKRHPREMGAAEAIREERLWRRHADMAKLGGTPKGGVNRQALSAEDAAARNLLGAWARARSVLCSV